MEEVGRGNQDVVEELGDGKTLGTECPCPRSPGGRLESHGVPQGLQEG